MKVSLKINLFLFLAAIFGCQAKLATESGNPEVTISGVDKKKVMDGIVAWSATKGQTVLSTNDYGLTTEGPVSLGLSTFTAKSVYTLVKKDSSFKVYISRSTIVDKTSYEKVGEDEHGLGNYAFKTVGKQEQQLRTQIAFEQMQEDLEAIKAFILAQ